MDTGNRFYAMEDAEVDISVEGRQLATLGAGDYFGEIALLRDVSRTATVTAKTRTTLLELERADFLEGIVGHPVIREAAEPTIVARMLEDEDRASS